MKKIFIVLTFVMLIFTGCDKSSDETNTRDDVSISFTAEMTSSYDKEYFAVQGLEESDGEYYVYANIFTSDGSLCDSFVAGKLDGFYGLCWEKDSYNIWAQTSDGSAVCFKYDGTSWQYDKDAKLPNYITFSHTS